MSLSAGARLGPYEILEPLGKGGMGEVFKAKDTRLDRFVAVKILPPEWAQDTAMIERFDREGKAIASLNHPNICALHDLGRDAGVSYLVMEYLQGETLAARISRGPLDLDDALDVAVPIADALDQAHRRGVIHRDLKPGNIMLTKTGPKLLDFGLARTPATPGKKSSGSGESGTVAAVPTTPLTVPGLLVGTLQYMAPEQLDGLEADARTDIFAFGTVLHEMITGKRAFEGKSQILLISAIATNDPPPLTTAQPATPPALEHVVKTCLAKNPDDRWQTARDLLAELKWIAGGGAAATAIMPATRRSGRRSRWLLPAVATLAIGVAAGLAVPAYSYFQGPPPPQELRYRLWPNPFLPRAQQTGFFSISADGSTVVFGGDQDLTPDVQGLYIGRIGDTTYRRLPGADQSSQPFWSPNATELAFLQGGRLMKLSVAGGQLQEIARVKNMLGGTWSADGTILLGAPDGIYRVSAEGGKPELLIKKSDAESGMYWPHFLPDGRRFLYLSWSMEEKDRAIMLGSLDGAAPVKVMPGASSAGYTAAGLLVFQRDDAVFARPFDVNALTLSGDPVRLAGGVSISAANGLSGFSVSRNGVLIYNEAGSNPGGSDQQSRRWQPMWIDGTAQARAVGSVQVYRGAEVSPDGTRIAMHRHDGDGGDIYVTEPSGTETRLTYEPARDNSSPIWSPDGQHVVFGANKDGKWGLYRRLSDGRGTEELLYESTRVVTPMSWSKDGLRIVFGVSDDSTNGDLWVLTLESSSGPVSKSVKPEAFASTPANETHGQISPDGRWLAFASDETTAGTYEIYVRPFPGGAGRWQVSTTGGDWPRWVREGQRLLFLSNVPENQTAAPATLQSVAYIVKGDTFIPDPPVDVVSPMRALNLTHRGGDFPTYAVGVKGALLIFSWVNTTPTVATPVGGPALAPTQTTPPDQEFGLTVLRHWEHAAKTRKR